MGLRPRPRWGDYSAPPDPLDVFKEPTSKERERKEEGEGKGMEMEGEGREGKVAPHPNWGVWIRQCRNITSSAEVTTK